MPRTRLGTKKHNVKDTGSKNKVLSNVSETEKQHLLERFDKQVAEQKLKGKSLYEEYLKQLDNAFQKIRSTIPKSDLSKTIEQLKTSNSITNTLSATSICSSTINSKQTFISCDEESLDQLSELRMTKMKNISDKSTVDMFKTPMTSKIMHNPSNTFGLVTPKVAPNAQLTVLRRPKKGEMVISMAGSPLQVNAVLTEEKANVNIPLGDGVVMSVQPNRGELRMSQVPQITDENTKREIITLIEHLNAIIKK